MSPNRFSPAAPLSGRTYRLQVAWRVGEERDGEAERRTVSELTKKDRSPDNICARALRHGLHQPTRHVGERAHNVVVENDPRSTHLSWLLVTCGAHLLESSAPPPIFARATPLNRTWRAAQWSWISSEGIVLDVCSSHNRIYLSLLEPYSQLSTLQHF